MKLLDSWQVYAVGSAFFAALTAIFGKIGVSEINSNLATFIRTVIILILTGIIVGIQKQWDSPTPISKHALAFLVASGLTTGLSWLCYYHALQLGKVSQVAPVDKLSVVLAIVLGILFLGEKLDAKIFLGGALVATGSIVLAIK